MDIKDYKEIIAADPSAPIDASDLSAEEHAQLEAFRTEMQALDRRIAQALEIDVPGLEIPELPAIETDSNVVQMPVGNKRRLTTPAWIGIAASFAVAAVIGVQLVGNESAYPSLAAEVVAHLDHEPQALRVTSTPVAERTLASVVSRGGAEIEGQVGLITYARTCTINGKKVPHLVVQGKLGPITLLLMPDEKVEAATPLSGENINGVILPVGDGSIAIIGEREENLDEIKEQVVDSVTWTI